MAAAKKLSGWNLRVCVGDVRYLELLGVFVGVDGGSLLESFADFSIHLQAGLCTHSLVDSD